MRLQHLGLQPLARLKLKVVSSGKLDLPKRLDAVRLSRSGRTLLLRFAAGQELEVEADEPATRTAIDDGFPFADDIALELVEEPVTGRPMHLEVYKFAQVVVDTDPWCFGVTDKIAEKICFLELKRQTLDVPAACVWLRRRFLVGIHDKLGENSTSDRSQFACATAGPGGKLLGGFRLLNADYTIDVEEVASRRTVVRLTRQRFHPGASPTPILLNLPIDFVDATQATVVSERNRAQLSAIEQREDAYLRIWDVYQTIEKRQSRERAKSFGTLEYAGCRPLGDGQWALELYEDFDKIQTQLSILERDEAFEAVSEEQARHQLAERPDQGPRPKPRQSEKRTFEGTFERRMGRSLVFRRTDQCDEIPPAEGAIILSVRGDEARLERRERASARIRVGDVPMGAKLGVLLELGEPAAQPAATEKVPEAKLKRLFGCTPTEMQRQAFHLALNTPDLAVIQGPPGTGKTKVIAALVNYLGERDDRSAGPVGARILVTSFQHEAVGKAATEMRVFGLPAVKLGRKRGVKHDADPVEPWRVKYLHDLDECIEAEPKPPSRLAEAQFFFASLLGREMPAPTFWQRIRELLVRVEGGMSTKTIHEIRKATHDLERKARQVNDPSLRKKVRRAAWAIPCHAEAYADCGPVQARRVLDLLESEDVLGEADQALLTRAAEGAGQSTPALLEAMSTLRHRLLDGLRPLRTGNSGLVSLGPGLTDSIATGLREWAQDEGRRAPRAVDVLRRLRTDLDDPAAARALVLRYTAVFAATCQQAVGGAVRASHKSATDEDTVTFESVIVDEAARASPLDLQIPMALARRRIVLVGDHRQLPHMLEPNVEAELADSISEQQNAALAQSLFHRMFEYFRDVERRPNIDTPRRVVTLDQQFRMHPRLARLISEQFYERHRDTTLKSPRPASEFAHDLKGFRNGNAECCAAWLEVPITQGKEQWQDKTFRRRSEASVIVDEVDRIAHDAPALTIGIIAFYRGQVDEIWHAMERKGWAKPLDDGEFEFRAEQNQTTSGKPRLRIGTVDSFQGLEFDVVLLSLTRCNAHGATTDPERRKKYGHLARENRLCVAMSRQQKLLIIVGDPAMVEAKGADDAVPALAAFRKLCKEEYDGCTIRQ